MVVPPGFDAEWTTINIPAAHQQTVQVA